MQTTHIALLRAVNVGGTRKLPMADLRSLCEAAGFSNVRTYIASGNVLLSTDLAATDIKAELEQRLAGYAGKPVGVIVRSVNEMADIVASNPFRDQPPQNTLTIFLDEAPSREALEGATGQAGEQMRLGKREIFVFYPDGQGRSRLKIPASQTGTARNMNTVTKIVEMAG